MSLLEDISEALLKTDSENIIKWTKPNKVFNEIVSMKFYEGNIISF